MKCQCHRIHRSVFAVGKLQGIQCLKNSKVHKLQNQLLYALLIKNEFNLIHYYLLLILLLPKGQCHWCTIVNSDSIDLYGDWFYNRGLEAQGDYFMYQGGVKDVCIHSCQLLSTGRQESWCLSGPTAFLGLTCPSAHWTCVCVTCSAVSPRLWGDFFSIFICQILHKSCSSCPACCFPASLSRLCFLIVDSFFPLPHTVCVVVQIAALQFLRVQSFCSFHTLL